MSTIGAAKNYRALVVVVSLLFVCAILAAIIPYLLVRYHVGDAWRGIMPQSSYDAMRYFARANDTLRGHVYAHNPYFFEHNHEPTPTPSLNDVLVALPRIAGLSFHTSYHLNIVLWSFVFLVLCVILFRFAGLSYVLSVFGALWCFLGLYYDATRPGAMSIVFPIFLIFLIFFYRYVSGDKRAMIPLGITAGLGIHSYVYLFMATFSILGVYGLYTLFTKQWEQMKNTLIVGIVGALVVIPHAIVVWELSHHEFYQRSLERIVYFYTHWPQLELYYYGRWVVLGMIIVYLCYRYFPHYIKKELVLFFLCTGGGILVAMSSNIITGLDFNIPISVGRFGILWYLILGVVLILPIIRIAQEHWRQTIQVSVLLILVALLVVQMFLNLPRSIGQYFSYDERKEEFIALQRYHGPITWLSEQSEGVVLAPKDMMMYIAFLTKQFILYSSHASLFMVSDRELHERLMLSRAFDDLSEDEFVAHYAELESNRIDMLAFASRERYLFCRFFFDAGSCPPPQEREAFVDLDMYRKNYREYYPNLRTHLLQEYAKYHVRYVVLPSQMPIPRELDGICVPSYRDQYYQICTMEYPTALLSG